MSNSDEQCKQTQHWYHFLSSCDKPRLIERIPGPEPEPDVRSTFGFAINEETERSLLPKAFLNIKPPTLSTPLWKWKRHVTI